MRPEFSASPTTVVRGEKTRKAFAVLLQRYRAAVIIQNQIKGRNARKRFKNISDASIVIQSGKSLVSSDSCLKCKRAKKYSL